MGKSSKKTTTKDTTQNTDYSASSVGATTGHSSVDVPDWLLNPAQKQAGAIGGIMDQGPGAFTPEMGDLTRQSLGAARGLDTSGAAYDPARAAWGGVGDVGADSIAARSLLTGLDKYYNPFKDQVLNPVLTDYDVDAGKTRAAQAATGALGAFRGSRFGVREGETEGNLARGRAAAEGGLLNQMYDTSTRLSGEDASRELTASQSNQSAALQAALANQQAQMAKARGLGDLTTASQGDIRSNLALQGTMGGQETDFINAQKQYPITFAEETGGLLGGLNPASYFGQSTEGTSESNTVGNESTVGHDKTVEKTNPGLLGNIGGLMQLAQKGMGIFGTLTGNPLLAAAGKV